MKTTQVYAKIVNKKKDEAVKKKAIIGNNTFFVVRKELYCQ